MAQIKMEFYSAQLMKTVHVNVILPCGEIEGNVEPPYRTVYFLPGFAASGHDLVTVFRIREYALSSGLAVVMCEGDNSFYFDRPLANYSTFVGEELVQMTRSLFKLSDKREDTFLAGISMGGFGTIYNGLKYSETFSKLALISPALEPYILRDLSTGNPVLPDFYLDTIFGSKDNFYASDAYYDNAFKKAAEEGRALPEIIRACGDNDLLVGEVNQKMGEYYKEKGITENFFEFKGGHDNPSVATAIPRVLAWLAGKEA